MKEYFHLIYTDSNDVKHAVGMFESQDDWSYWIYCVKAVADRLESDFSRQREVFGRTTYGLPLKFKRFISMLEDVTNPKFSEIKSEIEGLNPGLIPYRFSVEECQNER